MNKIYEMANFLKKYFHLNNLGSLSMKIKRNEIGIYCKKKIFCKKENCEFYADLIYKMQRFLIYHRIYMKYKNNGSSILGNVNYQQLINILLYLAMNIYRIYRSKCF